MADTAATIATFTVDRLAFSLSPPVVAAVVDFDGGGRFQVEMTDVDPEAVAIGQRVSIVFIDPAARAAGGGSERRGVHGHDSPEASLLVVEVMEGFVIIELEVVKNAHFCPQQSTELSS